MVCACPWEQFSGFQSCSPGQTLPECLPVNEQAGLWAAPSPLGPPSAEPGLLLIWLFQP